MLGNCNLKKTVTINNYKSTNPKTESPNTDKDLKLVMKSTKLEMNLKLNASKVDLLSSIKERKNYSTKYSRHQIATIAVSCNLVQPRKNVHSLKNHRCFKKNSKSLHPLQLKPTATKKKLHNSERNKAEADLQSMKELHN